MIPLKRKRILLFVGEGITLAHIARPYALADSLDPAQYEIHFACDPRYDFLIQKPAWIRWALPSIPPDEFLQALARSVPFYRYETLQNYVHEELALLEKIKPDLVVGDFRLTLSVSAKVKKIPYATITNAYWSPYADHRKLPLPDHSLNRWLGPWIYRALFSLLKPLFFRVIFLRALNRIRKEHGLPSFKNVFDLNTHADFTLYADIPDFAPTQNLPSNHRYLGPIFWSPQMELPSWWEEVQQKKPLIYVNLGSSGQINCLPLVVDTLKDLSITVVVATAGRSKLGNLPPHIYGADYLPGDQIAKNAAAVICNGGALSIFQALREGTPVVGIATNMDQFLAMEAVVKFKAGILLRAGTLKPPEIRNAVERILNDNVFQVGAQKMAAMIQRYSAPQRFHEFLEGFYNELLVNHQSR